MQIEESKNLSWIIRAVLIGSPSQRVMYSEITNLHFLFPFNIETKFRKEIYLNSDMVIERDGMNREFVVFKN